MKIALCSMLIKNGQCEANMNYINQQINQAITDQCDLVVFPQNAISGYVLQDLWLDKNFCRYVDSFNEKIIARTHDIAIVWGNIRYRNNRCFNSAFFAYEGKSSMRVKKNERHQDYFEESAINATITYQGQSLALNFGAEIQDVDLNINIDNAAYQMTNTQLIKANVCYVNGCGINDFGSKLEIVQGGSYVNYHNQCLYQAKYFESDYHIVDLNAHNKSCELPKPNLLDALIFGLCEFDEVVFERKVNWIVGLSGGLDSSISCAILGLALDSKRIKTYYLKSPYNSEATLNNAKSLCLALKIKLDLVDIDPLKKTCDEYFKDTNDLFEQNMQARIRGFLLNAYAAKQHGVVINNGNRIERMLGYCTMHGDTIGALSIIGDLSKVELFDLAKMINERYGTEVIPANLLPNLRKQQIIWENAPSAELAFDQVDPMKWYYHDYLIDIYQKEHSFAGLIERLENKTIDSYCLEVMNYHHLEPLSKEFYSDLQWVIDKINGSTFKRIQSPPYISVHDFTQENNNIAQIKHEML